MNDIYSGGTHKKRSKHSISLKLRTLKVNQYDKKRMNDLKGSHCEVSNGNTDHHFSIGLSIYIFFYISLSDLLKINEMNHAISIMST